jgi:ABC-type multidrug transport system fused ATPase/permease subunit
MAAQYLENQLAAAGRLFELVTAEPAVREPDQPIPPPIHGDIWVEGLSFAYQGTRPAMNGGASLALEDLNFYLPQGGRLAVVGPSGAGKTTLTHLLLRFWEYNHGSIRLGERELHSYRGDDVRRAFSLVSQHTDLFNMTIRENLLIARPDASPEMIFTAARGAQIHDFILSLPEGYDTWIGEQGLRLSGGERQRLAVARALLKDAPLLLLDEPTANLDPLTERRLLDSLLKMMEGRTTLLITHRLVGLEAMDEILVLDHGRTVERGIHAELIQAGGFYRRMWELQNQILPGTQDHR